MPEAQKSPTNSPQVADPVTKPVLTQGLRWALAIASGISVANLYYIQPLLVKVQEAFHISSSQAGFAAMLCQVGYALGMIFVVPLGDSVERRRLILITLASSCLACLGIAFSPSYPTLLVCCLFLGLCTCTPQLLVPLTAHLAPENGKGRAVGFVMSGLLLGILLARTVSGFVGQAMGWRAVFVLAASLMVVTLLWLRTALPVVPPEGGKLPYGKLLASLGELIRTQPVLQECAFFGAMGFGAFSAFWTSLTFLLAAAPFHLGPNAAGLFGLVGAGGALAAGVVGRLSDRGHPRTASAVALSLLLTSWAVFFWGRQSLLGLVIGTLLLDVGTQGNHIACQTRVFGLVPSARSRLNTIYMTSYFVGGSLGSATGAWAWGAYGWSGVCAVGSIACLLALVAMGFHHKRQAKSGVSLVGQV